MRAVANTTFCLGNFTYSNLSNQTEMNLSSLLSLFNIASFGIKWAFPTQINKCNK